MSVILDVFNGSAYGLVELTLAINRLPYVPGRIGKMGIFKKQGVHTTSVALERKSGNIALIPTKTRGAGATTKKHATKRDIRNFNIPHMPYEDELLAEDIQGVRAFGTSDVMEAINTKVTEKLEGLKTDHEVTHEYQRVGAIQGHVKDADGATTIVNLFTEFGVTETVVDFNLDLTSTDVKKVTTGIRRIMENLLGAFTFSGIVCECGDNFWDMFINHDSVKKAYDRWMDGQMLRDDQRVGDRPFIFADVAWHNYRGQVGSIPFIPTDDARFFPTGVPDLFVEHYAPADFIETVNTIGLPYYAKQARMKWDKGIEFHSQSNPAFLCSRPELLIRGIK